MTRHKRKCGNVNHDGTFRRCAACESAYFCSRGCQRVAWKTGGHPEDCKSTRRTACRCPHCFSHPRSIFMSPSSGKSELKQVDRDFLVDQGAAEIYRHMPGLKKIAERDVPGVPQSQIVFRIDYLTYPPKISLRKHLFDEGHQDLITGLNGGDLLWLEVRVPLGGNSYEQITHFSLARNLCEEGPEDAALPRRRLNFCDQDGNPLEVRGDEVSQILLRMQDDSKEKGLPDCNTALALKIVEEVLRADRDEKYFRQSTFVMAAEKQ